MKNLLILLCVLGLFKNACADNLDWQSIQNKQFFIGTHYYGLAEYTWPINYLNAIKKDNVESDLKNIKGLGFNTIILLASWSEFEPIVGRADNDAYRKINFIIKTARDLGLNVMIRIPYLWSLEGLEVRDRIAYGLMGTGSYRKSLLNFLKDFDRRVVQKNDNIVMKFGSWEDFYVLRDLFFSGEPAIKKIVHQAFSRDTGIHAESVQKNGRNYDQLMRWIDSKARKLTKEIGEYGYEIRTDADLFVSEGKQQWHNHSDFYKNEANGALVAYWAPYFGQVNNGESINSEKAIKSFSWMLDMIATKTTQLPFIDQLNFYDNSPGAENNANILEHEYKDFFDKLSAVVAERTSGYAFWTIRDYSHNLVFNPAFSEGLRGWSSKSAVLNDKGVLISQGGYISQKIPGERFRVLNQEKSTIVVDVVSGKAEVDVGLLGQFSLTGPGRHEIQIPSISYDDMKITVKPKALKGNKLNIHFITLYGHTQNGKILDQFGNSSDFFSLIGNFNRLVAQKTEKQCRGFKNIPESQQHLVRGVFSDRWTGAQIEICQRESNPTQGFRIFYKNPSSKKRIIKFNSDSMKDRQIVLARGEGIVHVCPSPGSRYNHFAMSVSPPFIPSAEDKSSPDLRSLGIFIKKIEQFDCQKKEGVW